MSIIYSITSTITRNIEDIIRKSFLFTLIFNIFEFIEKEWINSYFRSLYPSENFLSIFKKSKILKEEIFSPLIVLVTFTLFLLLATDPISRDLQIVLIIAFVSFLHHFLQYYSYHHQLLHHYHPQYIFLQQISEFL